MFQRLASDVFEASALVADYPPRIADSRKKLLFQVALTGEHQGMVEVHRFRENPLPARFEAYEPGVQVEVRPGHFDYAAEEVGEHWHLNFAHHDLFCAYGGPMFAQDEVQVAEHPALASLREALLARDDSLRARTVESGCPTPVLITNVERRCQIDTASIYGRRLASASDEVVVGSVELLRVPGRSNILAMEAPVYSGGRTYTARELEAVLTTAFSGFRAAALVSWARSSDPAPPPTVVHSGFWGCGAYGGDRQIMTILQVMAAELAGLDRLVIHSAEVDPDRVRGFAARLGNEFGFRPGVALRRVVDRLEACGFEWGRPDGN